MIQNKKQFTINIKNRLQINHLLYRIRVRHEHPIIVCVCFHCKMLNIGNQKRTEKHSPQTPVEDYSNSGK